MFVVDGVKVVSIVVVDTEVVLDMNIDDFDADDAVSVNDDDAAIIEVFNWLVVVFAILEIVTEVFSSVVFGVDKVSDKFASFPEFDKMSLCFTFLVSKNYFR